MSFTMKVDFAPAEEAAKRIDKLADRALLRITAAAAVNEVATRFATTAKREMNRGINLSDDYVASRVRVVPASATGGNARAEIITRGDLTIMGNYPIQQVRVAGSAVRSGTSVGRRPSGVRAEIKRGQAAVEPQWFTMRLRGSGKTGVFVRRSADDRPVHLYGPSPYSLFRYQIGALDGELRTDLETTTALRVAETVRTAL
jgi:hypothetical protein